MATILRPALVSLAPAVKAAVSVLTVPNLLISTLIVAVVALPAGKQAFASAPMGKTQSVACDQALRPLTLGIPSAVVAAPFVPVLNLGVPALPGRLSLDAAINLVLGSVPVQPAGSLPTPRAWGAVQVDILPNTLPLQGVVTLPAVQQAWGSAPALKFTVQVDLSPNVTLTTTLSAPPAIAQAWASAPPPKFGVQADVYQNLQGSTLPPPPAFPIALPLGLPVDVSQFLPKWAVQVDVYPNTVLLGIPAPIVPPPQPAYGSNNPTGGGGGGGKRDWPAQRVERIERKPPIPAAHLLEVQVPARPEVPAGPAVARIEVDQAHATRLLEALLPTPPDDDDDDEEAIWILLH